jgi:hypothetical protein
MKRKSGDTEITPADKTLLDDQFEEQDGLYRHYAEQLDEANQELVEAENQLEFVKAKLSSSVRADPGNFGLSKVTEAAINEVVVQQEEYREAQEDVSESRFKRDSCKSIVLSLDHRKTSLVKLADLFMTSYFAVPRVKGDTKEFMEERDKRVVRSKGVRGD